MNLRTWVNLEIFCYTFFFSQVISNLANQIIFNVSIFLTVDLDLA